MTLVELKNIKTKLESMQAELVPALLNREAIAISREPDLFDDVQGAEDRDIAIINMNKRTELLRNVRAAIRRIEDGNFGVCLHCEHEIPPKRLTAVPWSPNCLKCQEIADRSRENSPGDELEELTLNVA